MLTLYIALAAFALYTASLALGRGYEVMALFLIYILLVPVLIRQTVRFVEQRTYSRYAPWIAGVGILAVLVLIPFWDAIAGRIYFNYLCQTEGGVRVYKSVELGPEYYDENGSPQFITERGEFDAAFLDHRYKLATNFQEDYASPFHVTLDQDLIVAVDTNDVMGSKTSFLYFGGWLVNSIGIHVSGERCNGYPHGYYQDFMNQVFLRQKQAY